MSETAGGKKPSVSDIVGAILLAVDIDNSIKTHDKASGKYNDRVKTLAEGYLPLDIAIADPWLRTNAIFLYETPSSTVDWNRFRIVFLLNSVIDDPSYYSEIATAFIEKFGADKSCKNIDRFFFGCKNAKFEKFSDKPLRLKIMASVMNSSVEEESEINEYKTHGSNGDLTSDQVAEILKYIDGESLSYDEWFRVVSAIGNFFDESTAVNLVENWSPDKTVGTQYKIKHRASKPGIGSVIYFAKRAGFDSKAFYRSIPKAKSDVAVDQNGQIVPVRVEINLPTDCIFWFEEETGIRPIKLKLNINKTRLINFLNHFGFYKYWLSPSVSTFVKLSENILEETIPEKMLDFIHDFVRSLPSQISDNFTRPNLTELLLQKVHVINQKEYLASVRSLPDNFVTDEEKNMTFFFQNGCVKVTDTTAEIVDYKTLNGFVWKNQISKHDIELYPIDESLDTNFCMFSKFISYVCSVKNPDAPDDRKARLLDLQRFKSLMSALGYLLHTYKDPTITKAVIFCEEKIAYNDESNGRSGKGLTSVALGYLRNRTPISGKKIDFRDRFAFQEVTAATQLLSFEDTRKDFNLESIFNILTEGLVVELKGKKAFTIPYDKSPKVIVSTNYVIANDSDSYRARKFEIEFSDYFTADYTPKHEFGTMLFEKGWTDNKTEWDKFFSFLIACCCFYLKNGLIQYTPKNINERKLKSKVPDEFLEYAIDILSDIHSGERIYKDDIYKNFTDKNKFYASGSKTAIPQRKTTKWFEDVMDFKNINYVHDRTGVRSERRSSWIIE
jgi:hypothetical protein